MNRIVCIAAVVATLLVGGVALAEEELRPGEVLPEAIGPVLPETTTSVAVSSVDTNRIACPGDIQDVVYSGEKGFDVKYSGQNAFLKFKVKVDPSRDPKDGKEVYASKPVELYVVCDEQIYTLIAYPKRLPAQTIRLAGGKGKAMEANRAHFEGLPFEKMIMALVRELYTGTHPESYLVTEKDEKIDLGLQLDVRLKRIFVIEGMGLQVKELHVTYLHSRDLGGVELVEQDFLRREVTSQAVAVAIVDKATLMPGETTKVYVVERREVK